MVVKVQLQNRWLKLKIAKLIIIIRLKNPDLPPRTPNSKSLSKNSRQKSLNKPIDDKESSSESSSETSDETYSGEELSPVIPESQTE